LRTYHPRPRNGSINGTFQQAPAASAPRGTFFITGKNTAPFMTARTWWVVAAISLMLVAVPILLFNQQHSGDRLKIRRELRKF
jgi:hypothetical protein